MVLRNRNKGDTMEILIGEYKLNLGDKIIIDTEDLTEDDIKQIEFALVNTNATYRVEE
jgi:hypothetical protein